MIHKTAIIDSKAKISSTVSIGPYSIIGPNVEIEKNTIVQSHVNISGHTNIGENNNIYPFASIGSAPQDMKFKNEKTKLIKIKILTLKEISCILCSRWNKIYLGLAWIKNRINDQNQPCFTCSLDGWRAVQYSCVWLFWPKGATKHYG